MLRINRLLWDKNNTRHLLTSHDVTIDEVEDVVYGVDGEDADYLDERDGDNYVIYGSTGDGRLLYIALEPISPGCFRPFAARVMEPNEKRKYRNRKRTR